MSEISFVESPTQFLAIDEEGYFLHNGIRWSDEETGREILRKLVRNEYGAYKSIQPNLNLTLEAFDQPLVAIDVRPLEGATWEIQTPYGHVESFDLTDLTLDEWDRFIGKTLRNMSFVMSRQAQANFFDKLDEIEDEAIHYSGQRFEIHAWPPRFEESLSAEDWSEAYKEAPQPGWDLGGPHPQLKAIMPQLKLNKMRVLVLGCGQGHDAAFFAEQGHFVTAVDFSEEALSRARTLYGHHSQLQFVKADALNLPRSMDQKFDLIFEHTCYCAIPPQKRNDLTKTWRQVLADEGHVLGIFPVYDRPAGPPFSSSEWELRKRFEKSFQFLFWNRTRLTAPQRIGQEVAIYMQKKSV